MVEPINGRSIQQYNKDTGSKLTGNQYYAMAKASFRSSDKITGLNATLQKQAEEAKMNPITLAYKKAVQSGEIAPAPYANTPQGKLAYEQAKNPGKIVTMPAGMSKPNNIPVPYANTPENQKIIANSNNVEEARIALQKATTPVNQVPAGTTPIVSNGKLVGYDTGTQSVPIQQGKALVAESGQAPRGGYTPQQELTNQVNALKTEISTLKAKASPTNALGVPTYSIDSAKAQLELRQKQDQLDYLQATPEQQDFAQAGMRGISAVGLAVVAPEIALPGVALLTTGYAISLGAQAMGYVGGQIGKAGSEAVLGKSTLNYDQQQELYRVIYSASSKESERIASTGDLKNPGGFMQYDALTVEGIKENPVKSVTDILGRTTVATSYKVGNFFAEPVMASLQNPTGIKAGKDFLISKGYSASEAEKLATITATQFSGTSAGVTTGFAWGINPASETIGTVGVKTVLDSSAGKFLIEKSPVWNIPIINRGFNPGAFAVGASGVAPGAFLEGVEYQKGMEQVRGEKTIKDIGLPGIPTNSDEALMGLVAVGSAGIITGGSMGTNKSFLGFKQVNDLKTKLNSMTKEDLAVYKPTAEEQKIINQSFKPMKATSEQIDLFGVEFGGFGESEGNKLYPFIEKYALKGKSYSRGVKVSANASSISSFLGVNSNVTPPVVSVSPSSDILINTNPNPNPDPLTDSLINVNSQSNPSPSSDSSSNINPNPNPSTNINSTTNINSNVSPFMGSLALPFIPLFGGESSGIAGKASAQRKKYVSEAQLTASIYNEFAGGFAFPAKMIYQDVKNKLKSKGKVERFRQASVLMAKANNLKAPDLKKFNPQKMGFGKPAKQNKGKGYSSPLTKRMVF